MGYFAMQFEKLPERMKKFWEEEKSEKRGDKRHFCSENTQCIPAKSGKYHPLLLFIGIPSTTYPAGHGAPFPFL